MQLELVGLRPNYHVCKPGYAAIIAMVTNIIKEYSTAQSWTDHVHYATKEQGSINFHVHIYPACLSSILIRMDDKMIFNLNVSI